jgi:hypothetical protein
MVELNLEKDFWTLRPGIGLGIVSIGDNILEWIKILNLEYEGDLAERVSNFYKITENRVPDIRFLHECTGECIIYRSSVFDIWMEVDELLKIINIRTGWRCVYNGIDLINLHIKKIKNIFGIPSKTSRDSLGLNIFYPRIGVDVRVDKLHRVHWIEVLSRNEIKY